MLPVFKILQVSAVLLGVVKSNSEYFKGICSPLRISTAIVKVITWPVVIVDGKSGISTLRALAGPVSINNMIIAKVVK